MATFEPELVPGHPFNNLRISAEGVDAMAQHTDRNEVPMGRTCCPASKAWRPVLRHRQDGVEGQGGRPDSESRPPMALGP
eukprot:7291724-Alexandrium_andersonii.AAC.1